MLSFRWSFLAISFFIVATVFSLAGNWVGSTMVQKEFDAAKLVWGKKLLESQERESQAISRARDEENEARKIKDDAERLATELRGQYEKAIASTNAAGDQLRNLIKSNTVSVSSLSATAISSCQRDYDKLSRVLTSCTRRLEEVAGAADKIEIERRTARDGYPGK